MDESSFEFPRRTARPLWTRARVLGAAAGTLVRAMRLLVAPSRERGSRLEGSEDPRVVVTMGLAVVDDTDLTARPALEALLELTLVLRDGYDSECQRPFTAARAELCASCREHARRQTLLARRLAARLAALGTPVEPSVRAPSAAVEASVAPLEAELHRLLSTHRQILNEAKAFGRRQAGAARTTQQEIVVADVVATNRRQAATLLRCLIEYRGSSSPLGE
ncbi:MAG TPA: hypothetical protein VLJ38_21385 [Polyangiaceae bacterium]|nr:hypothetical protein [Polyangiaceae bacterium]